MNPSTQMTMRELSKQEASLLLTYVTIDSYSHAMERHPIDAPKVRDCFNNKGSYMNLEVIPGNRYLRICIVDEVSGAIGFQIVDIINRVAKERTAYIKESLHSIDDILRYIEKMGYPEFFGNL